MASLAASATHSDDRARTDLVDRFLGYREAAPLVRYRAVRHLRARNHRFNKEASMVVLTTLDPTSGFRFQVLSREGSELVLRRALLPILTSEARAIADGTVSRAALTTANYDFVPESTNDGWLRIRPRRRDSLLVDGSIFVRPGDGDLVRIEGRLSKSPSFWTTRVDVVRDYQRIAGVRVPVRMESRASIRLAGLSTLEIVYEYEEINGMRVSCAAAPGAIPFASTEIFVRHCGAAVPEGNGLVIRPSESIAVSRRKPAANSRRHPAVISA